jgi:hypothetical protein
MALGGIDGGDSQTRRITRRIGSEKGVVLSVRPSSDDVRIHQMRFRPQTSTQGNVDANEGAGSWTSLGALNDARHRPDPERGRTPAGLGGEAARQKGE